jgi:tetratricopeptide (TPR) repeat protein
MRRDRLMGLCGGADILTADTNISLLEWPARTLHLVRTDALEDLGSAAENPVVLLPGFDGESAEYKIVRDRLDRCRTAREFSVKSLVAMREGRIREAVSLQGEAPALCPMNGVFLHGLADYYIILSKSLIGTRRTEEAIGAARRAVELLPESPRTYYNLASIELTRDPQTAIALLDRAVTINPYYVPAYLLKAQVELAAGEPKLAAETVGRVLPMEPFNVDAHHIRGLSFIERRMYPEGRAELDLVLKAEPLNTDAIDALAYSWLVEEELDRAERLYERLLEIDPDHLGALNNYATILAEKGRYREAVTVWTRALELSPGNKDIIDNIEDARRSTRK